MSDFMENRLSRTQIPSLRTSTIPLTSHSSTRTPTDASAPEQQRSEKAHLHRRLQSNSLRHRALASAKHHRNNAKETVQSAIELKPPITFDQLLRRDKKTPESSRRGSFHQLPNQQYDQLREWTAQQTGGAERRRVTPEDVTKAREQNAQREAELRRNLQNIEELAMGSTRQLDDTYYSILEKASKLRSTVASLQLLAEESRKMHASFREDSSQLESDTTNNIGNFSNFDAQEKAIDKLVERLKSSKANTDKLNSRLEACRNRVEAYEQRENVKQKKRRQKWGAAWGSLVVFALLVVTFVIVRRRSAMGSKIHHMARVLDDLGSGIASPINAVLRPTSSPSEDPYLRTLFDEL